MNLCYNCKETVLCDRVCETVLFFMQEASVILTEVADCGFIYPCSDIADNLFSHILAVEQLILKY
jgi:hypothetical protein